ncbi:type II toxin-antitoxin system HicA family toxin [Candidatus Wolfebacteria bacterium]|nr:type II toxin-antitoxin system HicA family toxin [Candidatus Wolfebacteria bacterium]
MPRLPRVKPIKVIKAFKRAGFYIDHITGSHHILYKDDKSNPVSIPRHNKDLKLGTLKNILKQAKMSISDLNKYL